MEAIQACDKYNEGLAGALGRSWQAEAFVTVAALATASLLAALPLDLEFRAAGLGWIAFSAVRALRGLRPGLHLRLDNSGAIEVGAEGGSIRDGCFVAPWLTVVRWRPPGAWLDRTLLVAPGMLPPEDFRRLRVLLRFGDRPLGPLFRSSERTEGTHLAGGSRGS